MSDSDDRAAALKQVLRFVQPDIVPKLDDSEIEEALDSNVRQVTWVVATAYKFGAVVRPPTPNGFRYRCVVPGTSQDTDPGYYFWTQTPNSQLQDLSSTATAPILTWQNDGPEYSSAYDVRQSAYELWDLKLQKASQFIKDGDLNFDQVFTHCMTMRDSFAPLGCS